MPYQASYLLKMCVTCTFWTGPRKILHLLKTVEHQGQSGKCINRASRKFNATATYAERCEHHTSVLS